MNVIDDTIFHNIILNNLHKHTQKQFWNGWKISEEKKIHYHLIIKRLKLTDEIRNKHNGPNLCKSKQKKNIEKC